MEDASALEEGRTRDFIEFGFEPEFIGRLPVRVVCHPLSVEDLFTILKTSEGSIIRQYEQTFAAYGIEVLFGRRPAAHRRTGRRGNDRRARLDDGVRADLPRLQIRAALHAGPPLCRDARTGGNPAGELQKLLAEHEKEERVVARQLVHDFAARFGENHKLNIRFTEAAADRLVALALEQSVPVRELCAARFKDYQFGLKLIAQNTGQQEFVIDDDAVEAPDKILSEWVVKSYRPA